MNDLISNDLPVIIAQALEEMKKAQGKAFSMDKINLAELERLTELSRSKLRRLKRNGFKDVSDPRKGRKAESTILSRFTGNLDALLKQGVTNSSVLYERIKEVGYQGSLTTIKNYIKSHRDLIPAPRQVVAPQGNRGRRYITSPGEAFQMDWGFAKIQCFDGLEYKTACFAMICHHCGFRYIEFFPNAKQENLFIGMIHAFAYMGIPKFVLTDNMKSVIDHRSLEGKPVWNKDYEVFMKAIGFQTKVCKPRHPFTKGKVERLIRFVEGNFLAGRTFWNVTDLNEAAFQWCETQNGKFHKEIDGIPESLHSLRCCKETFALKKDPAVFEYLCPLRRLSFDGFVSYEGRRFGVPASFRGATARVQRKGHELLIYSPEMELLVTHEVTWSKRDRFCEGQFIDFQPEEFPTVPIKTVIKQLQAPEDRESFEAFNFDKEALWND